MTHQTMPKRVMGALLPAAVSVFLCAMSAVQAQSSYAPIVLTPPPEDAVDENFVSLLTGQVHFSLAVLRLGDVSFNPYTTHEQFDAVIGSGSTAQGGTADTNYGHLVLCYTPGGGVTSYAVTTECASQVASLQAIYGEQRTSFQYRSATNDYAPVQGDGSTFVDNVTTTGTCTWTQRDGTKIVYAGFHTSGNPVCQSHNIAKITHPDGGIQTYYYSGTLSTALNYTPSPIVSIATNRGYLLKYLYPGTPVWGGESSVVAINRAYESCDPTQLTCSTTYSWPTATLSWVSRTVNPADGYLPSSVAGYNFHYTFTLTDMAHRQHIFELDSLYRVISYQPPEATTPVYTYSLCSLHADGQGTPAQPDTMTNCFGYTQWKDDPTDPNTPFIPLLWDLVRTSTRNGQTWTYGSLFSLGAYPLSHSEWYHSVTHPLGPTLSATGNSTPGTESQFGPVDSITHYNNVVDRYDRSLRNSLFTRKTPLGVVKTYLVDLRNNVTNITTTPISGSPLAPPVQGATYPTTCADPNSCNKPTTVTDANGNTTSFVYDSAHGGALLTETDPAVSAIQPQTTVQPASTVQPQTRYTYTTAYAWYRSSSGVMTRETNGIFLKSTESYCVSSAATTPPAAPGCTGNDEVVTAYDYGPDSGPNNLILRGKTVTSNGQSLRTCYGHDKQGNTIWESSPNANPASCPAY
jgi:YD repeat-containing protein